MDSRRIIRKRSLDRLNLEGVILARTAFHPRGRDAWHRGSDLTPHFESGTGALGSVLESLAVEGVIEWGRPASEIGEDVVQGGTILDLVATSLAGLPHLDSHPDTWLRFLADSLAAADFGPWPASDLPLWSLEFRLAPERRLKSPDAVARFLPEVGPEEVERLLAEADGDGLTFGELAERLGATGEELNTLDGLLAKLKREGNIRAEGAGDKARYGLSGVSAENLTAAALYLRTWRHQQARKVGVRPLADEVGRAPSTVHEHLETLCSAGLVKQDESEQYAVSERDPIAEIALAATDLAARRQRVSVATLLALDNPSDHKATLYADLGPLVRKDLVKGFAVEAIAAGYLAMEPGRTGTGPGFGDHDSLDITEDTWFLLQTCAKCRRPWGASILELTTDPDQGSVRWRAPSHRDCPSKDEPRILPPPDDTRRYRMRKLRGQALCGSCSGPLWPVHLESLQASGPRAPSIEAAAEFVRWLRNLALKCPGPRPEHVAPPLDGSDVLDKLVEAGLTPNHRVALVDELVSYLERADLAQRPRRDAWATVLFKAAHQLRPPLERSILRRHSAKGLMLDSLLSELDRSLGLTGPPPRALVAHRTSGFFHPGCVPAELA